MPTDNIPQYLLCPITKKIMRCPVIALDGYVYEREAIEDWLAAYGTSYMLGTPMQPTLTAATSVNFEILTYLQNEPDKRAECFYYLPNQWKIALEIAIKHNNMKEMSYWIQLEPRLLTCPIKHDYTAFHYACEVATLSTIITLLFYYGNQIILIAKRPKPNNWKPRHLNELLAEASLIEEPVWIEALKLLGAVEKRLARKPSEERVVVEKSNQPLSIEQLERSDNMKNNDTSPENRAVLVSSRTGNISPAQPVEKEAITKCEYEVQASRNSALRVSHIVNNTTIDNLPEVLFGMQQLLQEQANLIQLQQEAIASMKKQLDYQAQQLSKQESWIAKLTQVDTSSQYRIGQLEEKLNIISKEPSVPSMFFETHSR